VVNWWNHDSKRHLAQEEKANSKKPVEEVKKTKSYASLKNWGHDTIKKREANGGSADADAEGEEQEEEKEGEEEEKAGDKRKAPDDQSGTSKKRETEDGAAAVDNDGTEKDKQAEKEEKDSKNEDQPNGKNGANGKETKGPEKGDTVSWNWGQGQPEGKVKEVNPGEWVCHYHHFCYIDADIGCTGQLLRRRKETKYREREMKTIPPSSLTQESQRRSSWITNSTRRRINFDSCVSSNIWELRKIKRVCVATCS
jgi:hypothetical protein